MASGNGRTTKADLQEKNQELSEERDGAIAVLDVFEERIAELEFALEDREWLRLSFEGDREFSRDGLKRIVQLARYMYLKNPLINHAVEVQAHYVFGQGVSVSADNEDVNVVFQKWWDNRKNQAELTAHQALVMKEVELQITGNLFFVFFTNKSSGTVALRTITMDEITDIITNPDDSKEPWYYRRTWAERGFSIASVQAEITQRTAFYPDWRYRPVGVKPSTIAGHPIMWDAPVYHIKIGGTSDMRFGVPEVYPALDWARAVKEALEDYSTVRRALAKFVWDLRVKGGAKGIAAAKTKLETTLGDSASAGETNPSANVASFALTTEGAELKPISTKGMQPSPDEGRALWLMVAAGTGIPHTILAGDADVGNLATAKTLDRPTELKMSTRRMLWTNIFVSIAAFVVDQSIKAPNGALKGDVGVEDGEEVITLKTDPETGEPMSRHIDVNWPSILERDVGARVSAVIAAATLSGKPEAGTLDRRTLVRLLLQALGEDDIDELVDMIAPEDGDTVAEAKFANALRDIREMVSEDDD